MPGSGALIFLLVIAALVGLFFLLGGPAEWRRLTQERLAEEKAEEEKRRTEAIAKAEADATRKALEEKQAARRAAMTVWSTPDPDLFAVPDEAELDRAWDDPDPDDELRYEVTSAEADELFSVFANDARLNWMVGLTDCQARADLMTEIAAERGIRMKKIWALPEDLDRGTIVSGFDGRIRVALNRTGTESMAWNFHVAPWSVAAIDDEKTAVVFDPLLFDKVVDDPAWRNRLSDGGDALNFEITDRYVYSDPFDSVAPHARHYRVMQRNQALAASFNLEDPQTWDSLQSFLRGRYADDLERKAPELFAKLREHLATSTFCAWWAGTWGYERLEEMCEAETCYVVPIERAREICTGVSPELREQALKEALWQDIAGQL